VKAVVLLSGGLDSTVALAIALCRGRECFAVSFDYGQRHLAELEAAKTVAAHYRLPHRIIAIDNSPFQSSALLSDEGAAYKEGDEKRINSNYVPARNTIFLAYALGMAEFLDAEEIYLGANADDREGFPDCRPAYLEAFQNLINLATKQSVEGKAPRLVAPLAAMRKPEILLKGKELGAPVEKSLSCYRPEGAVPCGSCQACVIRKKAFAAVWSESSPSPAAQ